MAERRTFTLKKLAATVLFAGAVILGPVLLVVSVVLIFQGLPAAVLGILMLVFSSIQSVVGWNQLRRLASTVILTPDGLTVVPLLAVRREVAWDDIQQVERLRILLREGPVRALVLILQEEERLILASWLHGFDDLEDTVRQRLRNRERPWQPPWWEAFAFRSFSRRSIERSRATD